MQKHETFGHWLKQQRKAKALTQNVLAQRAGCAAVTLRKIEADTLQPSYQIAARLIDQLGVADSERPALLALARSESPQQRRVLPVPLTSLLGRDAEVATICELLRSSVRLMTLTGPGGIGKTRLAIHATTLLQDEFADGCYFVDLAPIHDPDLVLPTIANVLDVREQPHLPIRLVLARALRDRQLLLVLDNLEHVLACAADLTALLTAVPKLTILVTSRVILNVVGEHVFLVPPLGLPPVTDHAMADTELAQYPAVALFVARAQASTSMFVLTEANAPIVAAICTKLDGLPLGIELAAARCRLFALPELLVRLDQRLTLLTHGAQDLPARQQTLRATIDWSYQLLDPDARRLLRQLAVFSGGCSFHVLETVVGGASAGGADVVMLLELVDALIRHNLVYQTASADGTLRLDMFETIREFALEQLITSGELEAFARHSAYYLALAEAAAAKIEGVEQAAWLRRLEIEHDNLRAALTWNLSPEGDPMIALQLAGALWRFWWMRNDLDQGLAWLTDALAAAAPHLSPIRARALHAAGALARYANDLPQAETWLQSSLAMYTHLQDHRGIADTLTYLGFVALDRGDYDLVQAYCRDSLAITQEIKAPAIRAWTLVLFGLIILWRKEYPKAHRILSESLALFRAVGGPQGMAHCLWNLTRLAMEQYDYYQAEILAEESLDLFRTLEDKHGIAVTMHVLGGVAQAKGKIDSTLALSAETLSLFRILGDQRYIGWVLRTKGMAAEQQGDTATAQACYEESRQLCELVGDQTGVATAMRQMAMVAWLDGDTQTARQLLEAYVTLVQELRQDRDAALGICLRDAISASESWEAAVALLAHDLEQFYEANDGWGVCSALRVLSIVLLNAGADTQVLECASEGLPLAHELDDPISVFMQLVSIATVALRQEHLGAAAQLCGAAEALEAHLGKGCVAIALSPWERTSYARTCADLRSHLVDPAVAEAWAIGHRLQITEAITVALAFIHIQQVIPPTADSAGAQTVQADAEGLSRAA